MGPIKFGMPPSEVAAIIGLPESSDVEGMYLREYRATNLPIVSYENGRVTEIEAFYDVENVKFLGTNLFDQPGTSILSFLERENGGAKINVGTVLFEKIGISTGRLDEGVREDHSVTAFAKGLWDDRIGRFKHISFA
jgi:hypothetical protein